MSVTIKDFVLRENSDGEEFFALIVESGFEVVKSRESGNYYATSQQASLPCTFDEEGCKKLIGQEIPGSVQRVECEPYDMEVEGSDEVLTFNHRCEYRKEGDTLEEAIHEGEVLTEKVPETVEA